MLDFSDYRATSPNFRLLGELSAAVSSAVHQPWVGPLRAWVTLSAKLYCAWNCYNAGVWPFFGEIPPGLLRRLRWMQFLPSLDDALRDAGARSLARPRG